MMKVLKLLVFILLAHISIPALIAQDQKEIFLKQIEFKLDKISDIDYENEYFMTIKLNKGTKYIFKITNHRENYIGEAVLELMDANNLIMTNVLEDKYFQVVSFQCNKTGFYDVLVNFKDKKLGNSIIDILMLQ
jgi:hypothetical protein